jgi:hypothetical protein
MGIHIERERGEREREKSQRERNKIIERGKKA